MEQKLVQKQTQKLLFTQKMQESMHILQMPLMDLRHLIENEMETNPILEEEAFPSLPPKPNYKTDGHDAPLELNISRPLTLQEDLLRQLRMIATSQDNMDIGEEIIGNIDENGYLKANIDDIARSLNRDMLEVEAMVAVVQSFEPTGVCSRDLKECLLIQLQAQGKKDSLAWRIAENHLGECGKKQYIKIAKKLGVSMDEITYAMREISRLEPKPGRKYADSQDSQYIVPDIYVQKTEDNEYQVTLNRYDIPNIRINSLYKEMMRDKNSGRDTQDYIKQKLSSANFIIKCIRERWKTMQKISECLIKEQGEAMEKGRSFIKPLRFKDIAGAVGRHESTISRAIANKYIETPAGIFELREFFDSKIAKLNSGENHSSVSVKMELKNLVNKENKNKPISDQKLQRLLNEKDIKISRRTIAKYREELKILPSYLRKS